VNRGLAFVGVTVLGIAIAAAGVQPVRASARSVNEEGNRLYRQKKYSEALKRYTEAQLEAPDAPQLHYNLGNVFFRQGELEKARDEYRRALAAANASLDPRAVYNLGNAFLAQEQYPDAVTAYQRALKLNSGDLEAKRNLELALLRLKEKKQQSQPQGGKEKPGEQKQSEAERKKDAPSPKPSGKPHEEQRGGEEEKQDQKKGAQKARGSLSREEAERILDALQEDEKANMKKRLQTPAQ